MRMDFSFNLGVAHDIVLPPPEGRLMTASPPMGLDDGHLFALVVPEIVTGTPTFNLTSDYVDILPSGHLRITDKAAFYGAMPVNLEVSITGTNGPEPVTVQCSPVAGYTDIELFRNNMSCHFDVGSNLGCATDDNGTYLYDVEDHGHLDQVTAGAFKNLYAWNPWFADRRPSREPSLMNPDRKAMRSVPPASTGATYGIFMATKGTDILNSKWHGLRYIRFDSNALRLQVTSDVVSQNSYARITVPSGNPLIGRTILLTIAWDAVGTLVTRINGIEVSRQSPAVYAPGLQHSGTWVPPANPGIAIFVGYTPNGGALLNGTIISHSAIGQHPWWEGAGWDGDWGEFAEILNVTGQV